MNVQYTTLEKILNEKMNENETIEGKLAYLVKIITQMHKTLDNVIDVMPPDQKHKLMINLGMKGYE